MKTTVLMATLGGADWDRSLPSLLGQSVSPDEIIVVIDRHCPVPEQRELKDRWQAVTFLFNDQNIGLTKSLNHGLNRAKGEFVFRADDDDCYRYDRIEKQLLCFEETTADLVASWAIGSHGSGPDLSYQIRCPIADEDMKSALLKRNILVHASLAFRRETILALGGYDENFVYAQDYALYLAAVRAGLRFAAVPEPLVQRSYSSSSITIARRYQQLMYSCAAQVIHQAHLGSRTGFLRVMFRYAILAATPKWARRMRRKAFSSLGRGH